MRFHYILSPLVYFNLEHLDAVDLQTNTNLKWIQNRSKVGLEYVSKPMIISELPEYIQ